jgi:hypothetical protein
MTDSEPVISQEAEGEETWTGDFDPFSDPEERRVLFAAFDSFRCVRDKEYILQFYLVFQRDNTDDNCIGPLHILQV